MRRMALERLSELASEPARCTKALSFDGVDFSRPFVHESLTPLFYAAVYRELSFAQRLRYNQLAAMKVNEQFVLLEGILVQVLLPALLRRKPVLACPALERCLRHMRSEEQRHLQMFRGLNQRCMPDVYSRSAFYFMREGRLEWLVFAACGRAPRQLTFGLWFLMLIEEYTVGFSRRMMRCNRTESLGELEPNFAALHREHVKDETRHIHVDLHLLDTLAPEGARALRRFNASLLAMCIAGMYVPKDTHVIVRHLVREHPELASRQCELHRAVREVSRSEAYQRSLLSREHTPITFSLFDRYPELGRLESVLPDYQRRALVGD